MPKIPKIKLAAEYLLKLADAHAKATAEESEQAHEQAETPAQETLEHMPGEYEEHGEVLPEEAHEATNHEHEESPAAEMSEHSEGEGLPDELEAAPPLNEEPHEDAVIEHMLSQLSPEQVEHLASQLSADIQHPEQNEGDDTAELAQAIQEHLAQNPEAAAPEAPSEKMAALNLMKSAEYIEGFLNQATSSGVSIKEAVDAYDHALVYALNTIKTSAEKEKHELEESIEEEKAEHKNKEEKLDELKKSAYFQGIVERSREYGFSDLETLNFVKQAGLRDVAKNLGRYLKGTKPVKAVKDVVEKTKNTISIPIEKAKGLYRDLSTSKNTPKRSPLAPRIKGEGADIGYVGRPGGGGAPFTKKKAELDDKTAAYYSGFLGKASAYGISEASALALLKQSMVSPANIAKGLNAAKAFRQARQATHAAENAAEFAGRFGGTQAAHAAETAASNAAKTTAAHSAPHSAASGAKNSKRALADIFTEDEYEAYLKATRGDKSLLDPVQKELINRAERQAQERVHAAQQSRAVPLEDTKTKAQKALEQKARAQANPSGEASFENTLEHSMSGAEGPLPPGMQHAIAARLGRAGKFMSENPLLSGVAGGAGAIGLSKGLESSPQEIPEQYYPYRR